MRQPHHSAKILLFVCFALFSGLFTTATAQGRVSVYVGEIKGPDEFVTERLRLLFMEEFSKIKTVDVRESREQAQLVLEGIGRVETAEQAVLLSVKLVDPANGKVVFVSNKTEPGSVGKATKNAVLFVVLDMKKALKWN